VTDFKPDLKFSIILFQFRHTVLNVDIISSVKGKERWNVMVRHEKTGAIMNKKCDAVIVAVGFVPSIVP